MSNRTWACVDCGKTYRRDQHVESVRCALCGKDCEYVHWKIRVPSPSRPKEWHAFWSLYRKEKAVLESHFQNPGIERLTLDLLNMQLVTVMKIPTKKKRAP